MSVMTCYRRDCGSIMCDRYSSKYGYICDGCFVELQAMGIGVNIKAFMATEAPDDRDREAADAYFDAIFQLED